MPHKDTSARLAYFRAYNRARRAQSNLAQIAYRARNRAFVAEVNARTVCAHCGGQPIEWHNPEHVELNRQHFRISVLQHTASIATIQAEMDRCTPLCRRCHMAEDGRLEKFPPRVGERAGLLNGRAKLSEQQVREIRQALSDGRSLTSLGNQFGVAPRTVSKIRDGQLWGHLV